MKQTKQFMQHMLLLLVGLVSTISVKAADYDFKAANSDGVTIYYKVNGENATVVAGDEKYSGVVNIPEIVTNDGKDYTVNTIGLRSFAECVMLTNVLIPNSVTIVESQAFYKDVQLTSVEFPNSIEKLGQAVCGNCTNLSSVHLPSSIKEIPKWAFYGTALKAIEIPYGVHIIDESAFAQCPIEKVIIPNSVVVIGAESFHQNSNLKEIIIPSSVNSIGNWAFNSTVSAIEKVTVMSKQPFEIPSGVFSYGSTRNATLYVPAGTKAIYQTTSGWGDFANIVEMEPEDQPYAVWCEGNTTLYFLTSTETMAEGGTYKGQTITKVWSGKDITESPFNSVPVWNDVVKNTITKVVFDESFKNVTPKSTAGWFDSCEKLETILGLTNLNTANVTDMSLMFYMCRNLTSIDVSEFDTSNVINMRAMFAGCSAISGLDVNNFNTGKVTDMYSMFADCSYLIRLNIGNLSTVNVTNMSAMFYGCKKLSSIDVSNFNTEKVTDMRGMFYDCTNVIEIDVSKFNTENVTDMGYMFYGCRKLSILDLSMLNTGKVTNMDGMFEYCFADTINLSNFDTRNVTSMKSMFQKCGADTLDLSSFNTDKVEDMRWMFYGCSKLKNIDLSNFRTSSLTEMRTMFGDCLYLEKVNMENWDISRVKSLRSLFCNCTQLKEVNISSFDTRNIETMRLMFLGCYNLKEVDLSSFNTANVVDVDSMFRGCTVLEKIYVGDGWNMDKVITHKEMFDRCYKIVGGNGTTYNSSYTNATYARIDTEDTPGYLTYKASTDIHAITLSSDFQTYCSDKDLDFTGVEGLKAYIASGFNPESGEVLLSHVNLVPAKTGMLLIGTAGQSYEVPFAETDFIYSNLFRGLLEDVEVTSGYVLKGNEFVAVDGTETVKGGEAYLNVAPVANARRLTIRFTDTEVLPSGIESVLTDETGKADAWYTLQGIRLSNKPSKPGVYVHQGRKVVVK